ncbi:MAG: aminoacyl-tRNA hydrolase [Candidatus Staskawiczbacteria bacterium]|jgi:PTH1 family peptidyl-tRNA hydrolase
MIIIIGLGNPGKKFENTRHNVGFLMLNYFANQNGFPNFELKEKLKARTSEANFAGKKILLVMPQTFMNESGKTIKKIYEQLKDQIEDVVVIHDDIDLPTGQIKIVKNRGSAGHKGVESIIKYMGDQDLIRIRVGIMPLNGKPEELKNFVLRKIDNLGEIMDKVKEVLEYFIKNGLEKTMNEYNK